jgi:hypothetical protein
MARVRNASPGPRILNVLRAARGKNAEPTPEQILIEPGEEQDLEEQGLELADPEDPVVQAMVESGELVLDGEESSEEDEEAAAQKRYLNDPKYLLDMKLAADAGKRFADPLPEGTETESEGSGGGSTKRSRGRPKKSSSEE